MKRAGKGFGVAGTAQGAGARERVAVARDPRARAYAQARRHSARVRFYKRVIPIGIAAGVALVLLFAFVGPAERLAGLSLGPISFSGTKIASRLTRTYTDRHGLKDLCGELLRIDLSKQQQSSDWGAETLTQAQIDYAASDVLHLHALKEKLDVLLAREGRDGVAAACFGFLPVRAELDLLGWPDTDIFAHS